MKFQFAGLAAAAFSLVAAAGAHAAVIAEVEGNDSIATAQNLDGNFTLNSDADIFDSTTIPHVTVAGQPGDGSLDYYGFSANAGSVATFDIDYALGYYAVGFDSWLNLFDSAGNLLAHNDDGGCCDAGTYHSYDAFLGYTFASAGNYFVAVGNYPNQGQVGGSGYHLQVSIADHALQGAVPEPAAWSLMLLGFGGIGGMVRARRARQLLATAA